MTDDDVVRFLQAHPEFFEAHVDVMAQIHIPDPHDGRAVPLVERQMSQLRERIRILETKLRELVTFGEENDAIGERLHRATLALIRADSLEDALRILYFNLREDFAIPHIAVRLWTGEAYPELVEFSQVSDETRVFAETLASPYCTPKPMFDSVVWFGEQGAALQSFAYVPIGDELFRGLLALGSEDPQRFYAEMGTLYLQRLGEITAATISRYL